MFILARAAKILTLAGLPLLSLFIRAFARPFCTSRRMTHRSTSSWDSLDGLDDWRELAGPPAFSGALDDDAEDARKSAASRADFGWRREIARRELSPTRHPIDAPVDAWFVLAEETLTSAPPRPTPTASLARHPTARDPPRAHPPSPRSGERDPRRTVTPPPPPRQTRNPDADANHPAREPPDDPPRVHVVLVSLLLVIHAATTTPFIHPPPTSAPRVVSRTSLEIRAPAPATPASNAVATGAACVGARRVEVDVEVEVEVAMRARTVALEAEVVDLRARLEEAARAAETAAEAEATRRAEDEEEAEARARAWYDAYREVRETCGRSESGARGGGGWMGAAMLSSGGGAWM